MQNRKRAPRQRPGCAVHQCSYSLSLPDQKALASFGPFRAPARWARGGGPGEVLLRGHGALRSSVVGPPPPLERETKGGSRGSSGLLSASRSVLSVSSPLRAGPAWEADSDLKEPLLSGS